jgi:hypothetical protein
VEFTANQAILLLLNWTIQTIILGDIRFTIAAINYCNNKISESMFFIIFQALMYITAVRTE